MKQDEKNQKHWIADESKCFQSLVTGLIMGNEIVLTTIHKDENIEEDSIENYIEIDDPSWQLDTVD